MAVIYKKGKKDLEYTGFDKVQKKFGDTLEKIKSTAKRGITRIPRAMDEKAQGDARREIESINRGFGSVENYEKLYPDTKKRNRELFDRAGF